MTLFEISDEVAPQVLERYQQASEKKLASIAYARLHSAIDIDDFRQMKSADRGLPSRNLIDRYLGSRETPPDFYSAVAQSLASATNFAEFQEILLSRANTAEDEIRAIEGAQIAGVIYTFGGHQHQIPRYATEVVQEVVRPQG